MSLFITFEGGEGSGKSLQARALYLKLTKLAIPVIITHEPGGTPLGQQLARTLKWAKGKNISALAEVMMFNASRAQLVEEVIQPALREGKVVICDRFTDSTIAYQSYGRGLDLEVVKMVNTVATRGVTPNLTVLLDVSVEEGLARKKNQKPDRFTQEGYAFHQKVRAGYLKLAGSDSGRWLVLDASQPKAVISEAIWQRVSQLLSKQGA